MAVLMTIMPQNYHVQFPYITLSHEETPNIRMLGGVYLVVCSCQSVVVE